MEAENGANLMIFDFLRTQKNKLKLKNKSSNYFKRKDLKFFGLAIVTIVLLNLIGNQLFTRFDLTKEKRYTLSSSSKNIINKLDDVAYFTIYLDGSFPKDYQYLKNNIRDLLQEYKLASSGKIEFQFEDVLSDKNIKEKDETLKNLAQKGLMITRPELNQDEIANQKYIIPAGIVYYKDKEYPINFLQRKFGSSLEEEINKSIEQLEYEISNVLRLCAIRVKPKLAILQGHGEAKPLQLADLVGSLSQFYEVEAMNINMDSEECLRMFKNLDSLNNTQEFLNELTTSLINKLNNYSGIICAKPTQKFKEIEKFVLDQYMMNGGKLLLFMDPLVAEMDSLARSKSSSMFTYDYNLNLDDLLFNYGVRVNKNLIQDLNCHVIRAMMRGGNRPGMMPWVFYPIITSESIHPIAKNMPPVLTKFVASIDTTDKEGFQKTVLLRSSDRSRIANNPVEINMNAIQLGIEQNQMLFNRPYNNIAVLIEGNFNSAFAFRETYNQLINIPFKKKSSQAKLIVVSDGDLLLNDVVGKGAEQQALPLGYDRFASQFYQRPVQFDNKKFVLNCVDYLCSDADIISVRSKEIKLRLLNKTKAKVEANYWKSINVIVPLLSIILFGLINWYIRKRKYTGF